MVGSAARDSFSVKRRGMACQAPLYVFLEPPRTCSHHMENDRRRCKRFHVAPYSGPSRRRLIPLRRGRDYSYALAAFWVDCVSNQNDQEHAPRIGRVNGCPRVRRRPSGRGIDSRKEQGRISTHPRLLRMTERCTIMDAEAHFGFA